MATSNGVRGRPAAACRCLAAAVGWDACQPGTGQDEHAVLELRSLKARHILHKADLDRLCGGAAKHNTRAVICIHDAFHCWLDVGAVAPTVAENQVLPIAYLDRRSPEAGLGCGLLPAEIRLPVKAHAADKRVAFGHLHPSDAPSELHVLYGRRKYGFAASPAH
jgi:hypothetical protein